MISFCLHPNLLPNLVYAWAAHLSWGGSSYSNCVKSSSVLTQSNSKKTFSKVISSAGLSWVSSSMIDNEGSEEMSVESVTENVVKAFKKLDPLA